MLREPLSKWLQHDIICFHGRPSVHGCFSNEDGLYVHSASNIFTCCKAYFTITVWLCKSNQSHRYLLLVSMSAFSVRTCLCSDYRSINMEWLELICHLCQFWTPFSKYQGRSLWFHLLRDYFFFFYCIYCTFHCITGGVVNNQTQSITNATRMSF